MGGGGKSGVKGVAGLGSTRILRNLIMVIHCNVIFLAIERFLQYSST